MTIQSIEVVSIKQEGSATKLKRKQRNNMIMNLGKNYQMGIWAVRSGGTRWTPCLEIRPKQTFLSWSIKIRFTLLQRRKQSYSAKPLRIITCHMEDACDPAPDVQNSTQNTIDEITFRSKDVKRIVRKLSPDKATGPDETPTRVLKECSAKLARPLSCLFELCFSEGVFPRQRKSATVIPVHKRKSKSDQTMYRPVSLWATTAR